MKLSMFVQKQKDKLVPKELALTKCKAAILKSGYKWTSGRQVIFNAIYTQEAQELSECRNLFSLLSSQSTINQAIGLFRKLHTYFNHLHFSNKLTHPIFKFLKSSSTLHTLAYYNKSQNTFAFNRRFFNTNFDTFCNTFQHEMCHQAVHDIDKSQGYYNIKNGRRDIHGEVWKKWMHHCKLNPDRCSKVEMLDFMDDAEKEKEVESRNAFKTATQSFKRVSEPTPGLAAKYLSSRDSTWRSGILVCPEKEKSSRWVVVSKLNSDSYSLVPEHCLFYLDADEAVHFKTEQWHDYILRVRQNYQANARAKKQVRHAKSIVKNAKFSLSIIPENRRKDYAVVNYVLTKTVAKSGNGKYSVSDLVGLFSRATIINALYWMQQVDRKRHICVTGGDDKAVLTIAPTHLSSTKYRIEDFDDAVHDFYLP